MAAALALVPAGAEVSAKGLMVSGKGGGGHHGHHHHRGFGYGLYGGGIVAGQTKIEPVVTTIQMPAVQASYVLKCSPSEEFKVVPSEEGGTREIKIRRC